MSTTRRKPGTKTKAKTAASADTPSTAGEEIIQGLQEILTPLKSGRPLEEQFAITHISLDFQVRNYTPALVKSVRQSLKTSQPIFAALLGVDPETVKSWEQGKRTPSPMACRFLDEIASDPPRWRERISRAIVRRRTEPTKGSVS